MAITINGSGTITGVSAGGLPDGSITADDLASTLDLGSKTLTIPTDTTGLPAGGLEEADIWKISANFTSTSTTEGLVLGVDGGSIERSDNVNSLTNNPVVGTGMSYSSGVFTFPSTGKWLVKYLLNFASQGGTQDYVVAKIQLTQDNGSNWYDASQSNGFAYTSTKYSSCFQEAIFDIQDTSNYKVRFTRWQQSTGTVTFQGNSNHGFTNFSFIKLGDT